MADQDDMFQHPKRTLSQDFEDGDQPLKIRRIARACLQCRSRKQRCLQVSENAGPQAPCKRCRQHTITCSFETDLTPQPDISQSPSKLAQVVVDLQGRLNKHESRIAELEKQIYLSQSNQHHEDEPKQQPSRVNFESTVEANIANGATDAQSTHHSTSDTTLSHPPSFSMDTLDLGPPIATLRSLGALDEVQSVSPGQESGVQANANGSHPYSFCDPISRGLLSSRDAQRAINIYFDHCHAGAPVLNQKLRDSWTDLRSSSPMLLLAICSIGARFWDDDDPKSGPTQGLHPKFFDLTALLDTAISRLLLRPTPSDVNLDSIRVLLLYAQFMPWSQEGGEHIAGRVANSNRPLKSRYNDISAWAVLGLAIRYSVFLGLDRVAVEPFKKSPDSVTEDDIFRLRVWYNLVTCDCNLTLTSGLPASVDPTPAASVARVFGSHRCAQQPGDLRVTALVELAVIIHRATKSYSTSSSSAPRQLDPLCLRKANTELDEWERFWVVKLRHTDSQHNNLPFNSIRWYRLALNSASLGPLVSSPSKPQPQQPVSVWLLQSLEISLTAAAQMLFSLSTYAADYVWGLESQYPSTFPDDNFPVDEQALKRLYYAVDSNWISHTFAVAFLVLCYVRKTIDDDLRICSLTPIDSRQTCAPLLPRPGSVIARLIKLALDIYDGVCKLPAFRPARDFQRIVQNASTLILAPKHTDSPSAQEVDNYAMQSLMDMMYDPVLEWPGNLFDTSGDLMTGWGVDGMLG